MYKCKCGKEFNHQNGLNCHLRFCKTHIKKEKHISIHKLENGLYECECKRQFNNYQSLNAMVGVLECIKLELFNRFGKKYKFSNK